MSVLLRQTHGFEGLTCLVVAVNRADLSLAEEKDIACPDCRGHAACATSAHHARDHHNSIIRFEDGFHFDSESQSPDPFVGEASQALMATELGSHHVGEAPDQPPFSIICMTRKPGVEIAVIERLKGAADGLNVLLRHRPRSIPQVQESA